LQVGELSVWVEQGPSAILAIVTRGNAPRELRQVMQRAIETIHLQYGEVLDAFQGDTQPFESSRPVLEECLQAEYRGKPAPPARRMWVLAAVILLGLSVWLAFSLREQRRWGQYLEALRNEPGLVVISSGRSGGQYMVAGLRDPLARDPGAILQQSPLSPDDVVGRWDPYQALIPSFVLARAGRALAPPPGTTLTFDNGVLRAEGEAPSAWIADARRTAPLIAGVSAFDDTGLLAATFSSLTRRIEAATLLFSRGEPVLVPGQDDRVKALAADLRELDALAAASGRTFRVELRGHTDADGAAVANLPLSRARAVSAAEALDLRPTPQLDIRADGVGSNEPFVSGETEADKQRNRRVTVRVAETSSPAPGVGR
jgi:OOP family OmpA-OmpF porin